MRGLTLKDRREDSGWLIEGTGHLDASTVESLDSLVQAVFDQGCYRLCLDFSGITSLSSAGAGMLLATQQRAQLEGGAAVVVGPDERVSEVLTSLGVTQYMQVVADRRSAWAVLEG